MSNDKEGSGAIAGGHTFSEILSQPRCWEQCLTSLRDDTQLSEVVDRFSDRSEWIFIGCGSSYYVALSAAATWTAITGQRAWAVPASEILLYPELVWTHADKLGAVLISRSGKTSEVIRVAEIFRARQISTLAISCASDQALEQLAMAAIILPQADEQSTVMTRSATSMLLALEYLAAVVVGKTKFIEGMHQLPADADRHFRGLPEILRSFVESNRFEDYVCLGQGPFYGLACESALKLTEMSCSYGQSFHTLEFRHGPKSIIAPETLVTFLLSEAGYQSELEVLEEIKGLGATTVAISPNSESRVRAAADVFVEMPSNLPELVRVPSYVFVPQLLALYTGLKKGLNPDEPRHLSRVVILNDEPDQQPATV